LGLGLNGVLFTIFNAYYFRTLPVREPHSLYEFSWRDRSGENHLSSWPEYQEFVRNNSAFSEALAYQRTEVLLNDRPSFGHLVTGEYFQMLGVGTALGRTLLPDDCSAPGREPVIVLSFTAWENLFGSAHDIIGKKVLIRGYPGPPTLVKPIEVTPRVGNPFKANSLEWVLPGLHVIYEVVIKGQSEGEVRRRFLGHSF